MGSLKTLHGLVSALCLTLSATEAVADALPRSPDAQVHLFASCTGRLSALMEHQRLFDGPASERSQALRDGFAALVGAVLPDAEPLGVTPQIAMHRRIAAKAAQAALLNSATFDTDHERAARNAARARDLVNACTRLLVS